MWMNDHHYTEAFNHLEFISTANNWLKINPEGGDTSSTRCSFQPERDVLPLVVATLIIHHKHFSLTS